jgi:hypothetical protein
VTQRIENLKESRRAIETSLTDENAQNLKTALPKRTALADGAVEHYRKTAQEEQLHCRRFGDQRQTASGIYVLQRVTTTQCSIQFHQSIGGHRLLSHFHA